MILPQMHVRSWTKQYVELGDKEDVSPYIVVKQGSLREQKNTEAKKREIA